jgi:hypothetical protein
MLNGVVDDDRERLLIVKTTDPVLNTCMGSHVDDPIFTIPKSITSVDMPMTA